MRSRLVFEVVWPAPLNAAEMLTVVEGAPDTAVRLCYYGFYATGTRWATLYIDWREVAALHRRYPNAELVMIALMPGAEVSTREFESVRETIGAPEYRVAKIMLDLANQRIPAGLNEAPLRALREIEPRVPPGRIACQFCTSVATAVMVHRAPVCSPECAHKHTK